MNHYTSSNTAQVLKFVREHPEGVKIAEVYAAFPSLPHANLAAYMTHLRREGLVYNSHGNKLGRRGGTWYPVTHGDDISEHYRVIASDLATELREIHYAAHELHLAKRLQEIFG